MADKKEILAICGSTRQHSTNLLLLHAIAGLASQTFNLSIFTGIAGIPHFNPDMDNAEPPQAVADFRKQIRAADAVIICTPEYAMGVPGTLKNAIDWTVSSCEFSHKPVALITASSMGHKGHASLLETLKIIEADVQDNAQLVISFAKTKVNETGITHPETLQQVTVVLTSLAATIAAVKS